MVAYKVECEPLALPEAHAIAVAVGAVGAVGALGIPHTAPPPLAPLTLAVVVPLAVAVAVPVPALTAATVASKLDPFDVERSKVSVSALAWEP